MKYKAFIFDLDGTLIHTEPGHRYKLVGQTLQELGINAVSNKYIDRFWFETKRDNIISEYFGLEPEQFWKTYRKYDTIELRKQFTKLYDDVDFIQELKEKGCKTGIVTGAPIHIANFEIDMLGKENFDAIVIANFYNSKQKPLPYGLEECLNLLNIKKNEAVYVGNAEEDNLTAKNAGVFDILLMRGEYGFELSELKPSLAINSLYDLRKLFDK